MKVKKTIIMVEVEPKELGVVINDCIGKGFDVESIERHSHPDLTLGEKTFLYSVSFVQFQQNKGEVEQ